MKGRAETKGRIYFMRRADGVGPIKIGCSKWPEQRLAALCIWSPEPLAIVATVPGTFGDERRLHRQFAAHRLHGEWFEAAPAVLAAMSRAAALGELPSPPAGDRTVRIMAMYEGGETLQAIADEFGVSRQRIEQIVRKEGGAKRGHVSRLRSPVWKQIPQVASLAKAGCTFREIADAVGDAYGNVLRAARVNGIEVRKAKRTVMPETMAKADLIAADYRSGVTTYDIAVKYGIPQPNIYRLLRLVGVEPNRIERAVNNLPTAEIALAYRNGATLSALAEQYGRTTTTIRRHLLNSGVALRTHAENEAIRVAAVSAANSRRASA